jgi:hypothetical protein
LEPKKVQKKIEEKKTVKAKNTKTKSKKWN